MILGTLPTLLVNHMIDINMNLYIQMVNQECLTLGKKLEVNGSMFRHNSSLT